MYMYIMILIYFLLKFDFGFYMSFIIFFAWIFLIDWKYFFAAFNFNNRSNLELWMM